MPARPGSGFARSILPTIIVMYRPSSANCAYTNRFISRIASAGAACCSSRRTSSMCTRLAMQLAAIPWPVTSQTAKETSRSPTRWCA
jgi:hypothetical protein